MEEIPTQYGCFKHENDFEFDAARGEVSEIVLKRGFVLSMASASDIIYCESYLVQDPTYYVSC